MREADWTSKWTIQRKYLRNARVPHAAGCPMRPPAEYPSADSKDVDPGLVPIEGSSFLNGHLEKTGRIHKK